MTAHDARDRHRVNRRRLLGGVATGAAATALGPRLGSGRAAPRRQDEAATPVPPSALPPPIAFEGFDIGARLNGYSPPESPWTLGLDADVFDRLYLPGQTAKLKVRIGNPTERPIAPGGEIRIAFADEVPLENAGVQLQPLAVVQTVPVDAEPIDPGQARSIAVTYDASDPATRKGTFALYATLADGATAAETWLGNIGVIFPAAEGTKPNSYFLGDLRSLVDQGEELEVAVLRKMGVKWLRGGVDWAALQPQPGLTGFVWDAADRIIDRATRHDLFVLWLGSGAPAWARDGRSLPHHADPRKIDVTPSPIHYGAWRDFWFQLISRHKTTIRAVNVWNEPWEGGGISGYGGTAAHYRELSRLVMEGVKQADSTVLVGGADSDDNINDVLLPASDWRQLFDLATYHGFSGYHAYIHRVLDLPLWNTENWYSSQLASTVQQHLLAIARGAEKVGMFIVGNFFSGNADAGGYYEPTDPPAQFSPQPNAIGYSALTHFLEDTTFVEEPHPDRLPYGFLFQGGGKNVAVLFGVPVTLPSLPSQAWLPYWQITAHGTISLPDPQRRLEAFDHYGNPYPRSADGSFALPFAEQPVYLTAGSLADLRTALGALEVSGTTPVQIALGDLTQPVEEGPEVPLTLTNVTRQTLSGTVAVRPPDGWNLTEPAIEFDGLAPGQSTELSARVGSATANDRNRYPFAVTVETSAGTAEWSEELEEHLIAYGTPAMAGDVRADWDRLKVRPIEISQPADEDDDDDAAPYLGRVGFAYDDDFLYLLAAVRDATEVPPVDQLGTWYRLNEGGYTYQDGPDWPFAGDNIQVAIDCRENPEDYLYPKDDPLHDRYDQREVDYLFGFYKPTGADPQVWRYRIPGAPFRHRYPFSPMQGIDQQVEPAAKLIVIRNEEWVYYEAALPLALLPDLAADEGATVNIGVKLTNDGQTGPMSTMGRSSCKLDGSTFQPYWQPGSSVGTVWRFAATGRGNR